MHALRQHFTRYPAKQCEHPHMAGFDAGDGGKQQHHQHKSDRANYDGANQGIRIDVDDSSAGIKGCHSCFSVAIVVSGLASAK